MKNRIFAIVGLFCVLSVLLLGLGYVQSDIMNSVRSFVRGEGLWAKAQKDAVFHLKSYVGTGSEESFRLYQKSLEVPLGDKQARLALQQEQPDLDAAFKGFLAGQNHAEDVPGMIRFFLYFKEVSYMRDAIGIWTEGDALIQELASLGERLRQAQLRNDVVQAERMLLELNDLNWQLADLEYRFSYVLSEGARWVKRVLQLLGIGAFLALLMIVLSVSRRIVRGIEQTERELLISENRFRSLYQTNILGIMEWHGDGRVLDANQAFLDMIGYRHEDLLHSRLSWRELTPQDGHERDNLALAEIERKGFCTPFEKEFVARDGQRVPVYLGAVLLDGEDDRGICYVIDQTSQKQAQKELMLSATVFDAASDGIMITDHAMRIVVVNKAFCRMTGYPQEGLLGSTPEPLQSDLMPKEFYEQMWSELRKRGSWQGDIQARRKDGSILPVRLGINAVQDSDQGVSHYVAIFTDISERKVAEDQLKRLAHFDFLTGLPNRSRFDGALKEAIQRARRHKASFAVLFIDLDGFKPVNDTYGHETGDRLLQEITRRLQGRLRKSDIIARLGGDEFVALLDDLANREAPTRVAEKLIRDVNEDFHVDGKILRVGCSIGIAVYPNDGHDGMSLLGAADVAMYAAKAAGRNQHASSIPTASGTSIGNPR